jgi:hypothetical protein
MHAIEPAGFVSYVRNSIRLRESVKFTFSRSVSWILEAVATWGAAREMSRDDLALLTIEELVTEMSRDGCQRSDLRELMAERRRRAQRWSHVKLGSVIVGQGDVYCHTELASIPNFVGRGRVQAPIARLGDCVPLAPLRGRVVCIESADPGYDWIFSAGIAGLVTRYGGSNSHMAVRCVEHDIPAAIGCGERWYVAVAGSPAVLLDCDERVLAPLSRAYSPISPS